MKTPMLSLLALAAALIHPATEAALVDASFNGVVQAQQNAAFTVGHAISGSFVYDTGSASFLSFTIGGQSVAPGYQSQVAFSPDMNEALYTAQLSPVPAGSGVNSTFTLDLGALATPFAAASPIALLSDTAQLAADLDTSISFFSFYTANADGSGVHSVTADLTDLSVTAPVPEPSTLAMLAAGLGVMGLMRGRQRGG